MKGAQKERNVPVRQERSCKIVDVSRSPAENKRERESDIEGERPVRSDARGKCATLWLRARKVNEELVNGSE